MTGGGKKPGSKPAIPPDLLLHLERRDASLREAGITPEFIGRLFGDHDRMLRANAFLADIVRLAVMHVHQDDGWIARRRLKDEVRMDAGLYVHVRRCEDCAFWIEEIRACVRMLDVPGKTAPTE